MSAPVDVLAVIERCAIHARSHAEEFALQDARAAVAELIEAAREFCRGMPVQYADNAAVVGNCNARQIENMRDALARVGGAK